VVRRLVQVGAAILVQAAFRFISTGHLEWAMAWNKFLSTTVRILLDRSHTVASGAPYRYIRHPGHEGYMVLALATPLILSTLWALIPAALTALITVVRTALEDRTLLEELRGYTGYARAARYRLLPGVW